MSILDGPGPVNLGGNTTPAPTQTVAAPATTVADPLNPQPAQSGGFLNDLGVDWAGLDVNNEPAPGTYRCFLIKSEVRQKKDGTKSWVFSYKVQPGQPEEGKVKEDWRPIPQVKDGHFLTEKDGTFARFLKQRLMELGVPEERVGSVVPNELNGIDCFVTITLNNGYRNVTSVVLASEVQASGLTPQTQQVQGLI